MGWWRGGMDGSSLHMKETGLVWGDRPADLIDGAIEQIIIAFQEEWDRKPLKQEIISGLLFSLAIYDECME